MNDDKAMVIGKQADLIRSVDDLARVSQMLFKSGLLPNTIKSAEAAAATIILGREVGFSPMVAFGLINVIQGKPTVSPQGMLALIHQSGLLENLSIEDNGETCTVTMKRKGQTAHSEKFSMEDAKRMMTMEKGESVPLAQKYNWRQMPAVMRKWRAVSACARVVFPDLIAGLYFPEEMGAEVNEEGEVIEVSTDTQQIELPTVDTTTGEVIGKSKSAAVVTPTKKTEPIASAENNSVVLQIKAMAQAQFKKQAGTAPTEEQAKNLASIVVSALDTRLGESDKNDWRKHIYKRITGVESAMKMDGAIFNAMYFRWKSGGDPTQCNDLAKADIASLIETISAESKGDK